MKAIGYVRVSTLGQAEKGISLAAQQSRIRAMATLQEADLTKVIVDAGESGKNLDRPGMQRLLAMVERREVDAVIIAKLDRLTRSVKDLANLLELFERRGIHLLSVAESLDTGSAAGRLVMNIMASLAQWEREVISERTKEVLGHKKAREEGKRDDTPARASGLNRDRRIPH
jgi:DNA invertase Pin-like site-specific DNA recombinase